MSDENITVASPTEVNHASPSDKGATDTIIGSTEQGSTHSSNPSGADERISAIEQEIARIKSILAVRVSLDFS